MTPPAETSPSRAGSHRPPPRSALRTVLLIVAFNGLIAAGWWMLQPRRTAVLTDGETIRLPRRGAPISEILWQPPTELGAALNTGSSDYEPRFAWDGLTLFFVRERPGENADIFVARRTPGGWSTPEPLAAVNTTDDELGPAPSPDGAALYFYSDRPGGSGGYDLWVSRQIDGQWQPAANLGPRINSPYNDYGPAATPDGAAILFASNRPRESATPEPPPADSWTATLREDLQRRTYDLYRAPLEGEAAAPTALDVLNTEANEGAPCFSTAGDFLYFASNRAGGAGGFDLYRARWLRDRFLPPQRLAAPINSAANELDPALHSLGYGLIFSSDRPRPLARRNTADTPASRPSDQAARLPDYDLYQSTAREVFRDVDEQAWDWDAALRALMSYLPWLLLALLSLLLLALGARGLRDKRLSLMARCVMASLLLHSLLMLLFSFWQVTAGVMQSQRPPGGTQVALVSAVQDELAEQVTAIPMSEAAELALAEARPPQLDLPPREIEPIAEPEVALQPAAAPPTIAVDEPPLPRVAPRAADSIEIEAPPVQISRSDVAPDPAQSATNAPVAPPVDAKAEKLEDAPAVEAPRAVLADAPVLPPIDRSTLSDALPALAPSDVAPAAIAVDYSPAPRVEPIPPPPAPSDSPIEFATSAMPLATAKIELSAPPQTAAAAPPALPTARSEAPTPPDELATKDAPAPPATASLQAPRLELPKFDAPIDAPTSAIPSALPATINIALPPAPLAAAPGVRSIDSNDDPKIDFAPPAIASKLPESPLVPALPSLALPPSLPDVEQAPVAPSAADLAVRAEPIRQAILEKRGGSPETEAAVKAALVWLSKHQSESGAWNAREFGAECECDGAGEADLPVATTGLALLCFLGAGHTHTNDGPYQDHVRRAINWLARRQLDDGDLRDGETMYSHGIATIALSEACAMTSDPRLRPVAERAVNFIVESRNRRTGGWRYEPGQAGDTSVLGWQVLAIKSGQRAGVEIPEVAYRNIRVFLERVADTARPGRYAYRPRQRATASMTAEAVFVRQLIGDPLDDLRPGLAWIATDEPNWNDEPNTYYWYYATLALFNAQGEAWDRWNAALSRTLIDAQQRAGHAAGSWDPEGEWASAGGRVYQTALCTLMLEVYYRYLPMYAGGPVAAPEATAPASAPTSAANGD